MNLRIVPFLNNRVAIATLIGLTVLKLLTIVALSETGRFKPFYGDNAVDNYIPIAKRLLFERRFNGDDSRPDSKIPPAYPAVLAVSMWVVPHNFALITVCTQVVADLVTAFLLWWLGRALLDSDVGAIAGALWLVYPPEVVLSTWITAEVLFATAFVAGLSIYVAAAPNNDRSRSFLAGCVLAIATLFRPTTMLFPLILAGDAFRRRASQSAIWLLVGFAMVLSPWFVRNVIVLHDPIPVAVGFGSVFLQGADERTFTIAGKREAYRTVYEEAARAGITKPVDVRESGIDRWLFRVGAWEYRQRLAKRPWSFVPFSFEKFLRLWYSTESGGIRSQAILALLSLPIVIPAFIELYRLRGRVALIIVLSTLYFVVLHVVTLPLNRYMLPIYALLMIPACHWWLKLVPWRSAVTERAQP